jgi:transcriptional regulator with XRE-family HTH domain
MVIQTRSPLVVDGPKVRLIRDRAGLTLRQFARDVITDATHLSRVERGLAQPSASLRNRIAARLGVSIDDIARPRQAA